MYKLGKKEKEFLDKWRGKYVPEPTWYGLMTQYGQERQVRDKVRREFGVRGSLETLLPELAPGEPLAVGDRSAELLFPCYLFIHCSMNDEIYMRIAAYEGVVQFLGRAWRIPSVLDDREIQHLRGILRAPHRPEMIARTCLGDEVEVTAGILQGLRGNVLEVTSIRVKLEVRFSFLNNRTGIAVVVPRSDVRLVNNDCDKHYVA